jgi:hypothetical protein
MPVAHVLLSDIHFGQDVGGNRITHDDVKERLIEDTARQVKKHAGVGADITGAAAYSGKANDYKDVGAWRDRLIAAVSCSRTAVQVVPGNGISQGYKLMLDQVIARGGSHAV